MFHGVVIQRQSFNFCVMVLWLLISVVVNEGLDSSQAFRERICAGLAIPPLQSQRYAFYTQLALVRASQNGRVECALDLLKDPVSDANATDSKGLTALAHVMARDVPQVGESSDEVFRSLGIVLMERTLLTCKEWKCSAPLVLASQRGRHIAVDALLAAGAKPDATDELGEPALQHAAAAGHLRVIRALVYAGAQLDAKGGEEMRTALHRAASHGHVAVVDDLMAARADPRSSDAWGRTPQELAEMQGHTEVARAVAPLVASGPLSGGPNAASQRFLGPRGDSEM